MAERQAGVAPWGPASTASLRPSLDLNPQQQTAPSQLRALRRAYQPPSLNSLGRHPTDSCDSVRATCRSLHNKQWALASAAAALPCS